MLYRVKVKIDDLIIRSGPGKLFPTVYRYASGEYDVYEEKRDSISGLMYGRIGVGKWICISPEYVDKLADAVDPTLEARVTNLESRVTVLEQK